MALSYSVGFLTERLGLFLILGNDWKKSNNRVSSQLISALFVLADFSVLNYIATDTWVKCGD